MARLWRLPGVAKVEVVVRPDLRRTLGRFSPQTGVIEVSAGVLRNGLGAVLRHEAAHAAVAQKHIKAARPHGPEWQELMVLAGEPQPRAARWCGHRTRKTTSQPRQAPNALYDHRCPVCHNNRKAKRPVRAWRCAPCVAAGLEGHLEITRRPTKSAANNHR
jgi:predicted SprT family Zn-dependent metalloprotease